MPNITAPFVGQKVRVRHAHATTGSGADFLPNRVEPGMTATVVAITDPHASDHDLDVIEVRWDQPTRDNGWNWSYGWFEPAYVDGDAAGRPLIHFDDDPAGRDRSKARAAASEAVSRVLKPEHNEILAKAANGESVDAYALNEAITAAIRSAATRHGQSTARREQAKRFAHVAHIVQAVLENHADNLPAYAEGERSRLLESERERTTALIREKTALEVENEDLKLRVVDLRLRVGAAAEERATLTQAASDERRRLTGEIDSHLALIRELKDDRDQRDREIEVLLRVLDYTRAECCADEAARQRSFGFEDGLRLH